MFVVELVYGKEHPRQSGPLEFENLGGKTVGLLSPMRKSYFPTGRYVIIDSGFYILKGLINLSKKGIFACTVIKKIRNWPNMVPDKETEDHFGGVEMGDTDTIQVEVDYVIYNLWGMKGPNYVMREMATGGRL